MLGKERLSVFEAASDTGGGTSGLAQNNVAETAPISPIHPIRPIDPVLNYDLRLRPDRIWRNTSGQVIRVCIPPEDTISSA